MAGGAIGGPVGFVGGAIGGAILGDKLFGGTELPADDQPGNGGGDLKPEAAKGPKKIIKRVQKNQPFEITVRPAATVDECFIEARGVEYHVITASELEELGIKQMSNLQARVADYTHSWPEDAVCYGKCGGFDLYDKYGYEPVHILLKPVSWKVAKFNVDQQSIYNQTTCTNNSSVTSTFNTGCTCQVQEIVTMTSTNTRSIGIQSKFKYDFGLPGIGGGEHEITISGSMSFAETNTKTTSVTAGSTYGVSVTLKPHESCHIGIAMSRGDVTFEVKYKVELSGYIACNWRDKWKGHHFWFFPVNHILHPDPSAVGFTQFLTCGFFCKAELVVEDEKERHKAIYYQS